MSSGANFNPEIGLGLIAEIILNGDGRGDIKLQALNDQMLNEQIVLEIASLELPLGIVVGSSDAVATDINSFNLGALLHKSEFDERFWASNPLTLSLTGSTSALTVGFVDDTTPGATPVLVKVTIIGSNATEDILYKAEFAISHDCIGFELPGTVTHYANGSSSTTPIISNFDNPSSNSTRLRLSAGGSAAAMISGTMMLEVLTKNNITFITPS